MKIKTILKCTQAQIDKIRMDSFFMWAGHQTHNAKDLQKVLNCRPIARWFQTEYKKYEQGFIDTCEPYLEMPGELLYTYYNKMTVGIIGVYPAPLLDELDLSERNTNNIIIWN